MSGARRLGPPQLVILGLLGGTTLLVQLTALARPELSASLLVSAGLGGLLGALVLSGPRPRLAASLALGLALLLAPEGLLRLAGFGSAGGVVVHFGWPRPQHLAELAPDPETFWALPAGAEGVNALGLAGPEPELPKPSGRTRVVLAGDSVTQYGLGEALAEALSESTARTGSARDWDAANLGVVGYTAVQGQRRLARWLPDLDADVVLVGFGWNDHWRAMGAPDLALLDDPLRPGTLAHALLSSVRLLQLGRGPTATLDHDAGPRVPPEDFEAALLAMASLAREAGAEPVFWTLPSSHPHLGVPEYLVAEGFAASSEAALADHATWAAHVEAAGARGGVPVVSLAGTVADAEQARLHFTEDGIHLSDAGRAWVAGRLAEGVVSALRALSPPP